MALIECPDCKKEVSDSAPSCPNCGAPIAKEGKAAGVTLTTVQGTSKRLKLHSIGSAVLLGVGLVWIFTVMKNPEAHTATPGIMVVAGLVWFITTRVRTWWHHS